jgi:hypothetical protein
MHALDTITGHPIAVVGAPAWAGRLWLYALRPTRAVPKSGEVHSRRLGALQRLQNIEEYQPNQ